MKHGILITLLMLTLWSPSVQAETKPDERGRIFLQVQSYGRMWYVSPATNQRYYFKDAKTAGTLVRTFGTKISEKDIARFPVKKGVRYDAKFANQYRGGFVLANNEAWYINPKTSVRRLLGTGDNDIFRALQKYAAGISDAHLRAIPMNTAQIVPDTAFGAVASARLRNGARDAGQYADTILPLASLAKLMSALVLLDYAPQWERLVTITESHITYPKKIVGDDTTSEVLLKAGQRVSIKDLWTAMLVSSSNQAAIALIESAGFSEEEFVAQMNKKASALGLSKTVFYDGAGLDAHTASTAYETALIAEAAFSNAEIATVSSQKHTVIAIVDAQGTSRILPIQNRNYSVLAFEPDGVKTGFLVEAQRNVALKKGDTIIVVLHGRSMNERNAIIKKLL